MTNPKLRAFYHSAHFWALPAAFLLFWWAFPASAQTNNYNIADVPSLSATSTATLTNKRINPRVTTAVDAASITPNGDTSDEVIQTNTVTPAGTFTINAVTGTPVDGQKLIIRIKATNAHTLSFDTSYTGSTDVALPTTLTGSSKYDYLGFIYNSAALKWNLVAKSFGY